MATDRVYGDFQWAGVKVTTAAKSQVKNDGTDAYAMLVSGGGSSDAPSVVTEQGLGTLGTNQVAVAATATLIVAARATRGSVLVVNPSAVIVYVGNSASVTTANGIPVGPGQWVTIPTTSAIYGISASGTNTVAYGEVY